MLYTDQIIACVDCSTEFTFSAKEQEFYAQKGFTSVPKRCKPCRMARKDSMNSRGDAGGGAPRSSGGYGGGASYGGGSSYGGSGGYGAPREREMHTVTCAACGVETQVPFKPRGDRPVYCRSCFQK
jgi:CxxC-x17-CxxC domain-containing protein